MVVVDVTTKAHERPFCQQNERRPTCGTSHDTQCDGFKRCLGRLFDADVSAMVGQFVLAGSQKLSI